MFPEISPSRSLARRSEYSFSISARTASCSARIWASLALSLVPIVFVPLNIMCSNRCEMPVMPGPSLTEPTFATQPQDTVGESWRSTISSFNPLGSSSSRTLTCCAPAAAETMRTASAVPR